MLIKMMTSEFNDCQEGDQGTMYICPSVCSSSSDDARRSGCI